MEITANENSVAVEDDESEEVKTPIDFLDDIEGDKVEDLVEILAGLDPVDPKYNSSKRDLIIEARQVWKATGL